VVLTATGLGGAVALILFALAERHPGAMAPVALFSSRVFTAANLMTFLVYGALGAVFFFLVLQLQVTSGFSPLVAGMCVLPATIAMLLLSSRFAALSARIGPRLPMTIGPLLCAAGVVLVIPVDEGTTGWSGYWTGVIPGMTLFALGLATLVSPLTAAVLAAAPDRFAGAASGINNAVARAGSLLAVAALPAAVGLSGADYMKPSVLTHGYRTAMAVNALMLAAGGIVSFIGLARTDVAAPAGDHPGEPAQTSTVPPERQYTLPSRVRNCSSTR
jgi:hypothetical protein